jgi:hypothetical protein
MRTRSVHAALADALRRVGVQDSLVVDVVGVTWRGWRVEIAARGDLEFLLPGGGTWFARPTWRGPFTEALALLASLPDDAGWSEFWRRFNGWHVRARYWPDDWEVALRDAGIVRVKRSPLRRRR